MNMKTKFSLSVAAALCLAASAGQPMKFLSFNIWGDYFKNPVGEREAAIESTIRQYAPDVISLQEVTPNWWNGLKHEIGTDQTALDASDHSPVLVEFELR